MQASTNLTEARRWAKFPATVLLVTGILWLLQIIFTLDKSAIGQRSESFVGAAAVFIELVVIPLGSVAVGLGLLFLQRWALLLGFVMPLLPLLFATAEKIERIVAKFAEWRSSDNFASFGDGVMHALLLLALWGIYGLLVHYILKSMRLLDKAQDWLRVPATQRGSAPAAYPVTGSDDVVTDGNEVCFLMPEGDNDEL